MCAMSATIAQLDRLIAEQHDDLVGIRHDLHAHPQLGYQETHASAVVKRELDALRVPYEDGIAETGVVAWLKRDGDERPAIALRADMDALPIREETGLPWASKHDGCMHACGHDGHTTMLLGAARVLSKLRDALPRPVKFIFQPAEEGGAGGQRMTEAGVLDQCIGGNAVAMIFGLHGMPQLHIGTACNRVGPMLAATDALDITIHGEGGHAAMPHKTADPIVAASAVVTALQSITSRDVDPAEPIVLTVGSIHGGNARNVIPDEVNITGTIRTLSTPTAELVHRRVHEVAEQTAAAHRCRASVTVTRGYPVMSNHPAAVAYANEVARAVLGEDLVMDLPFAIMGGEDFAFYGQKVPSCFTFIGVCPPDQDMYPGLHTPKFDFTDEAIPVGVRLHCAWALNAERMDGEPVT